MKTCTRCNNEATVAHYCLSCWNKLFCIHCLKVPPMKENCCFCKDCTKKIRDDQSRKRKEE